MRISWCCGGGDRFIVFIIAHVVVSSASASGNIYSPLPTRQQDQYRTVLCSAHTIKIQGAQKITRVKINWVRKVDKRRKKCLYKSSHGKTAGKCLRV